MSSNLKIKIVGMLVMFLLLLTNKNSIHCQIDFPSYKPLLYEDSTYYSLWKNHSMELDKIENKTVNDYWNQFIAYYKAKTDDPADILYLFYKGLEKDKDGFCSTYFDVNQLKNLLKDNYYKRENIIMNNICSNILISYNPSLLIQLKEVQEVDQLYRTQIKYDALKQKKLDSINLSKILDIYSKYGYTNRKLVGVKYESVFSMVILHSDLPTMKKFIPIIKKQCDESDLDIYWYAALMDRTLVLEGKDQIYGTQYFTDVLGETKLVNIKSIESVNEARKAIGLKPLTL